MIVEYKDYDVALYDDTKMCVYKDGIEILHTDNRTINTEEEARELVDLLERGGYDKSNR